MPLPGTRTRAGSRLPVCRSWKDTYLTPGHQGDEKRPPADGIAACFSTRGAGLQDGRPTRYMDARLLGLGLAG